MEQKTPTTNDQPATKKQVGCGTQIIAITILSLLAWGAYELFVFGLGEVCEALACAVGQIAPNPCYR